MEQTLLLRYYIYSRHHYKMRHAFHNMSRATVTNPFLNMFNFQEGRFARFAEKVCITCTSCSVINDICISVIHWSISSNLVSAINNKCNNCSQWYHCNSTPKTMEPFKTGDPLHHKSTPVDRSFLSYGWKISCSQFYSE